MGRMYRCESAPGSDEVRQSRGAAWDSGSRSRRGGIPSTVDVHEFAARKRGLERRPKRRRISWTYDAWVMCRRGDQRRWAAQRSQAPQKVTAASSTR